MLIRKLAELAIPAGTGPADVYTVTQLSAVISTLIIANSSALAGTVGASHAIAAATDDPVQYFMIDEPIVAKGTPGCRLKEFGITMGQGDVLRVAPVTADVVVTVWGEEQQY